MATLETSSQLVDKPKIALLNNPKIRNTIVQVLLLAFIAWLIYSMASNAAHNLAKAGIAQGFGFLTEVAGLPINFSPFMQYDPGFSTYGHVYWIGLFNTILLAVIGIFFATIIGFVVGVARLSSNWVINRMAYVYVEVMRNIPLLLQIFLWYKGVGAFLPGNRTPADLGIFGQLNAAGLHAPAPQPAIAIGFSFLAFLVAVIITMVINSWASKRQMATGKRFPVFWIGLGLIVAFPVITYIMQGVTWEYPTTGRFGPRGGMNIPPELIALLLALSTYTAAFIAEIVRAGILAINKGQSEAAHALGIRQGPTLRLVIIPQALRVIIPPLTSQFLNLTKNSSLAVAIAYPDLTAIFAGTALNQTGQAVEILLMTMLTYLFLSLMTSMFMNWYNSKMALVER